MRVMAGFLFVVALAVVALFVILGGWSRSRWSRVAYLALGVGIACAIAAVGVMYIEIYYRNLGNDKLNSSTADVYSGVIDSPYRIEAHEAYATADQIGELSIKVFVFAGSFVALSALLAVCAGISAHWRRIRLRLRYSRRGLALIAKMPFMDKTVTLMGLCAACCAAWAFGYGYLWTTQVLAVAAAIIMALGAKWPVLCKWYNHPRRRRGVPA